MRQHKTRRASGAMKLLLLGSVACLAGAALFVLLRGSSGATVPLDVELKVTDEDYHPLAGVPVRLVFGTQDWQAPDAGIRIVTDQDGMARFSTPAVIARRWSFTNIGFTPFSMPFRADHLAIAAELAFVIPKRDGGETAYHWLYTARVDRLPDGDCSTDDLDKVYEAGPDGRFTRLVGRNAAGPNFDGMVDGWRLASAGYRMWDSMLDRVEGAADSKRWHLKLGLMRRPKPILPK
jgi:hypothetical protein